MKKLFTVIGLIVLSKSATANGNRVGNGGDVVVCKQVQDILDFYENDGAVRAFANINDRDKILEEVLRNLDRLNPRQAKQYRARAGEFLNETEFKSEVILNDIQDSKHLFSPKQKKCKIKQIAIRLFEKDLQGKRFIIDKQLWDQLSARGQAGLIMHEVIYEHLYKLGEEDSVRARKLNAYLFSNKVFADSVDTYWKFIKDLSLPIYRQ